MRLLCSNIVSKGDRVRIREEKTIRTDFGKADVLESIRELEEQHKAGEIETHAYFIKKRALVKML